MYFKINEPFGFNICFALALAWEAFQTGAPKPISLSAFVLWLPDCLLAYSPAKWGLLTKSLMDVWLQHSREQGCRDVTTLHQVPQKLNLWRWNSALFTTKTAPGVIAVLQDSSKVYHSCEISVVPWTNGNFAGVRGGWQTLSIPECCWDGGCLSPSHPPACLPVNPSLLWGYRCPRRTKGRPVSTWQIENFFKPRSFKCKWNLVLASLSFQQE